MLGTTATVAEGPWRSPGQALDRACAHFCHQADDRAIDLAKEDPYGPGTFGEVGSAEAAAAVVPGLLVLVIFLVVAIVAAASGGYDGTGVI